jgi:hypothetical protein
VVALERNADVAALVGAQWSRGFGRSCIQGSKGRGGGGGSLPRHVRETTGGGRAEPLVQWNFWNIPNQTRIK